METFRAAFERTFQAQDIKQNVAFPVQVPAGTTHFCVRLHYDPRRVDDVDYLLTLTIFDSSGWRGEGHRGNNRQELVIAADGAAPGFIAGPVPAGEWKVVVNTHMVLPQQDCSMRLEVWGTDEPVSGPLPAWTPARTAPRGRGWYRGDLHAHTFHSDADWDVAGLAAYARAQKLDFAALTDHNTVSALGEMLAAGGDDLLILPGMELTTFWGHAVVLGTQEWVDWRVRPGQPGEPERWSMTEMEAEVSRRGGLFIIAHPRSEGDPKCTGCDWLYSEMEPGAARVVEVWNTEWFSNANNEDNLRQAYEWLNQGYRMALTAGADNHGGSMVGQEFGYNVVYAEDLTQAEILKAVRAGRLYLSAGPSLVLQAACGDERAGMGEVMQACPGSPIQLSAVWENTPEGAVLELVVDGEPQGPEGVPSRGYCTWDLDEGYGHWALATLRAADGRILALTNPVFWDGRE
jgi:hypothetical protein